MKLSITNVWLVVAASLIVPVMAVEGELWWCAVQLLFIGLGLWDCENEVFRYLWRYRR